MVYGHYDVMPADNVRCIKLGGYFWVGLSWCIA